MSEKEANSSPEKLTLSIQQAIDLGMQHHSAGRLPEAESIYQKILQTDPNQPVALHLLGSVAHQVGNNDLAVELITKALAIKPDFVEAHSNLGSALLAMGKLDDAVTSCRNALAIQPDYIEAHINLGNTLKELGRLDEAITHYHKAIDIKPDYDLAYNNLGGALKELGRLDEAISHYQKAIDINPDYDLAHSNLGLTLMKQVQKLPRLTQFVARLPFYISYLESLGVMNATLDNILNGKGENIPLLTNSFLHWFETIDWSGMTLLELGSGNSTLYFSKFFKSVTAYEPSEKWFKFLQSRIPKNVDCTNVHSILSVLKNEDLDKYDVILLDPAENRAKIARIISEKDYSGSIFFDNSEWYRQSIGVLSQVGFSEIPFFGIKPVQDWVSCTSVLVKPDCLSNWITSEWKRFPDLARPRKSSVWDNENSSDDSVNHCEYC